MNYHELLRIYIEKSGLSLGEIEERMREKGFSTNRAYISRLQNSKIPPAGDDINEALAEVLEIDAEELILQANIIRSPVLGNLINTISETMVGILKINKDLVFYLAKNEDNSDELLKSFNSYFEEEGKLELMISMIPLKIKLSIVVEMFQTLSERQMVKVNNEGELVVNLTPPMSLNVLGRGKEEVDVNEDEAKFLKKQLELYRDLNLDKKTD